MFSSFGVVNLPTYLAGVLLIVLLPGPNSLYVLSVAARRGVRAGYAGAAGVFCGDTVLMTLSAAGVASLFQTNAMLFGVVKYVGAAYLAWVAIGMLRSGWEMWRTRHEAGGTAETVAAAAAGESGGKVERPFRRAFVVSLLNPKAILFFISFFVQFVDPNYAYPALSFLVLGAFAQIGSVLYLSALIFGGTRLAAAFRRRRRLSAGASSAAGALFLGFAAKLSLASA
ncbi:leucine efflux protein LeuE [Streptomyces sp. CO7]